MIGAAPRTKIVEDSIIEQIAVIDIKIEELKKERDVCERMLIRVRREGVARSEVNRKDSVNRIIVERAILDALSAADQGLSTKRLLAVAKSALPSLKPGTFRSTLTRMKTRVLDSAGRGKWRLRETAPERKLNRNEFEPGR